MDRQCAIVVIILILVCLDVGVVARQRNIISLGAFKIRKDEVTLSGISGGAAMATQVHMAHSSMFSGVALFAMAFYRCGGGNLIQFGLGCTTVLAWLQETFPSLPIGDLIPRYNMSRSIQEALKYANVGLIDPVEGLANQKVFVWAGERDIAFLPSIVKETIDFYSHFIPNQQNLQFTTHNAEHDFPTDYTGKNCSAPSGQKEQPQGLLAFMEAPEVRFVNCNYSGAYEMMKFMVGNEITKPNHDIKIAELQMFNQSEFYYGTDIEHISLHSVGLIYVPEYCKSTENECLLHFHFHGCGEAQSLETAKYFFTTAHFLHVAEANNIIMVFPLARRTYASLTGCWDFYSYTGPDYATKVGAQMKVVHRILERLMATTEGNGVSSITMNLIQVLVITCSTIFNYVFLF